MKAALVHDAIHFPLTHDLEEVVSALPYDSSVRDVDVDLTSLSRWAVAARYPGAASSAPQEDASVAMSGARAIVAASDLGSDRPPRGAVPRRRPRLPAYRGVWTL